MDADLCASCGICVGACPSSTPFRSAAELVTGIDMPQLPIGALRRPTPEQAWPRCGSEPTRSSSSAATTARDVRVLAGTDVATFSLICTGMLPPSFVEYALRDGAAGVLVTGCGEGGCEFRLGQRWTAERLPGRASRTCAPRCRASGSRWPGPMLATSPTLHAALQRLRQRIARCRPGQCRADATPVHG